MTTSGVLDLLREYAGYSVSFEKDSNCYVLHESELFDGKVNVLLRDLNYFDVFEQFENFVIGELQCNGRWRNITGRDFVKIDLKWFSMWLRFKGAATFMSRKILWNGVYESAETAFIEKVVESGYCCVDAGAHIGYHTLLMSKLAGDSGRVYSFEVDDNLLKVLQENISLNSIGNVYCHHIGLSDQDGSARYVHGGSIMSNDDSGISCMMQTLDRFLLLSDRKSGRADFVKIDTSGYDCKILRGMKGVVVRNPDIVIMMEYNPSLLALFGDTNDVLVRTFEELGLEARTLQASWNGSGFVLSKFSPVEPIDYAADMSEVTKKLSSDPNRIVSSIVLACPEAMERLVLSL